jgi:hypothetical protein
MREESTFIWEKVPQLQGIDFPSFGGGVFLRKSTLRIFAAMMYKEAVVEKAFRRS